jgi:hypothetical protein
MRRAFASEIKTARVRLILDNLDRLHEAADRGSVSAMRALAGMMQPSALPQEEEDDQWADVVGEYEQKTGFSINGKTPHHA